MEREIKLTIPCPVCGNISFEEEDDYDICPVCKWENDPLQRLEPDFPGSANHMSLNQYKKAWEAGEPCR